MSKKKEVIRMDNREFINRMLDKVKNDFCKGRKKINQNENN